MLPMIKNRIEVNKLRNVLIQAFSEGHGPPIV